MDGIGVINRVRRLNVITSYSIHYTKLYEESEKDRKITTIITGFMPCGAKVPIFAMFVSVLFADSNKTLVTFSIYMLSIAVAITVSLLLNKFVYKSTASNFVMELPQYRIPTLKSVGIHGYEKIKDFAVKAGTIILLSTT